MPVARPAEPPKETWIVVLGELFFLHRLGPLIRVALLMCGAVGAVGAALLTFALQSHFVDQELQGIPLNLLTSLFAEGSSITTAWPGWVAAGCFLNSVIRAWRRPAAPRGGWTSITELRSQLRSEYRWVRVGLCLIAAVTIIDLCRAILYVVLALGGNGVAQLSATATVVEALGFTAAAVTLGVWAWQQHCRLVQWGAVTEDEEPYTRRVTT